MTPRSESLRDFMDKPNDPKNATLDDVKLIDAFNDTAHPLTFKPQISVPADAVTASGSGLDPHISRENTLLQADRVAAARRMPIDEVKTLIDKNAEGPDLGILGKEGINVVTLNLALDKLYP